MNNTNQVAIAAALFLAGLALGYMSADHRTEMRHLQKWCAQWSDERQAYDWVPAEMCAPDAEFWMEK